MNLRTTLFLAVLLVGGGAALWFGPELASNAGLRPKPVNPDGAGSLRVLNQDLTRDRLRKIEVRLDRESVQLEKGAGGAWALPGNWPTRTAEAQQLVDLVANLHSRFQVVPLSGDKSNMVPFGLDSAQNPVTVRVDTVGGSHTLVFGEADRLDESEFARPTYVRVDDLPEVVRLGPDILPIIKRPREYYRRRQLFPNTVRVKLADSKASNPFGPTPETSNAPVSIPRIKSLTLVGPQAKEVLTIVAEKLPAPNADRTPVRMDPLQLAESWSIAAPVKDRADPDKLKALLSAIPDLWVEKFSPAEPAAMLAASLIASPADGLSAIAGMMDSKSADLNKWAVEYAGLDRPEYKLSATLENGEMVSLEIGKVARVSERPGVAAPPARPGMPPMPPPIIREEYRFARLKGQQTIFEIKADRFAELFPSSAALRDEKLARFQTKDVKEVKIKQASGTIVLVKDKDEKKDDKWRVTQPIQAIAELDKINELLDKLAGLEARDKDVIDNPNLKDTGFDAAKGIEISLSLDEEMPGPGESKTKRQRRVAFAFGKHDEQAKKVNVRVSGRERVNLVDESAIKLAERPALAYRGRRVLDFDAAAVAKVEVKRPSENFTLQHVGDDWKLTAPVSTPVERSKATALADDLGRLEAVEYVNDAPKAEDLAKAGLDKPQLTVRIAFSGLAKPAQTLLIGKQREKKPEYFAKLAGGTSIFVVKKDVHDSIDKSSLDYRPTQLWTITPDDLTELKIEQEQSGYELKRDGFNWKIVKPFEAVSGPGQVQSIVDAIATLKLSGYQAHTLTNPAEYGLDRPRLKIEFTAKEKDKAGKEQVKQRTLLLGKAVAGKPELYAKLGDDSAVFRVPESVLLSTNKSALDLLDRQLLIADSQRIGKIERSGGGRMTAIRGDKGWKIQAGAVSFPADEPTIATMLRTWGFLQAEKIAAYGSNVKLDQYGLNPPADTITISFGAAADGKPKTHVLKLGKATDRGDRYVQVDANPAVAVLAAAVVKSVVRDYLDFADKSLLHFDESELQGIRRQMKNNDMEITRKDGWKVIKPAEQKGDEPSLDQLAKQLANLRGSRGGIRSDRFKTIWIGRAGRHDHLHPFKRRQAASAGVESGKTRRGEIGRGRPLRDDRRVQDGGRALGDVRPEAACGADCVSRSDADSPTGGTGQSDFGTRRARRGEQGDLHKGRRHLEVNRPREGRRRARRSGGFPERPLQVASRRVCQRKTDAGEAEGIWARQAGSHLAIFQRRQRSAGADDRQARLDRSTRLCQAWQRRHCVFPESDGHHPSHGRIPQAHAVERIRRCTSRSVDHR